MWFDKRSSFYDAWLRSIIRTARLKDGDWIDYVFLGVSKWTGEPILLPLKLIFEHMLFTGGSGSGKTALIMIPLLAQIIARKLYSVVHIDQKGDNASFWGLFDEAQAAGVPFKYFSLVPGEESFVYNPLSQDIQKMLTPMQLAELFTMAAGLDFGEGHGPSFFRAMQELVFGNYLSNYTDPPIENLHDFYKLFNDKHSYNAIGQLQDYEHASHIRGIFAHCASVSSLNATARTLPKSSAIENAIQLSDLFRSPAVYYFRLPASVGKSISRFVGRDLVHRIFTRAGFRSADETVPVILSNDEFQINAGPGFDTFLEQCRSRGIGCCLAAQSLQQLQKGEPPLLPIVLACASTHIVVEASDPESVEYVQKRSGKAIYPLASWSQEAPVGEDSGFYDDGYFQPWKATSKDGMESPLVNVRQELGWRLDENEIAKVSADPTSAFIAVKKNDSFCQMDGAMIPIQCFFHIDREEFRRRDRTPWPTWERPETVIVKLTNPLQGLANSGGRQPKPPTAPRPPWPWDKK